MNNLISPYNLGDFGSRFMNNPVAENCRKISVNELIRKAQKMLKKRLVEAQIEALGVSIDLITSKTRFNGERLWFKCPMCNKRAGTLFCDRDLGCRKCLRIIYRKQRFKGMVEST